MNKLTTFPTIEAAGPARFTAAEFLRMGDTGAFADMKMELVEGKLQRMSPPGNDHSRRQGSVAFRLMNRVGESLVRIDVAVLIDADTVVGPDIVLLTHDVRDQGPLTWDTIRLAVEVAESTLDRDLSLKRLLYAAAGIPHYWVVDGKRSVVHVFGQPTDGDYGTLALVPFGSPLAVPGTDAAITLD